MNNKVITILLGMFLIIGVLGIPSYLLADNQIQVQEDEINVEMIPNNPQPYEDVTINITSYATDLSKAIITWQSGSSTVLSGIGKTSYSFKTLGPNTRTVLNISVKPVESMGTISKSVVINPSEIETLWESVDGYTPPFYKGKSLPTKGSIIKVVAIPSTDTIKSGSGSISYSWKNGDSAVPDASGYNKNSYTFTNSVFDNTNEVTVNASSVSSDYSAESTVNIPIYDSKIIFYKRSPTEGVLYNKALDSNSPFPENEMTVVAEPYFLAIKNNNAGFIYNWKINGDSIDTPSKKTELTIRPASRGGYATINLVIENVNKLFQNVSGTLKLTL